MSYSNTESGNQEAILTVRNWGGRVRGGGMSRRGKGMCAVGAVRYAVRTKYRGRILGSNWDKSLKSSPPGYSQSPLQTDFIPLPTRDQKWFKTGL